MSERSIDLEARLTIRKSSGELSELKALSARQAKVGFGRLLERVVSNGGVTITVHGQPKFVMLSIETYQRMSQARLPVALSFEQLGSLGEAEREHLVRRGVRASLLSEAALRTGLRQRELLNSIGASSRRILVREERNLQLSVAVSRRIARLARLWWLARELYETEPETRLYLTSPVPILGGTPLRAVATKAGFEGAVRSLEQLAHGVLA